MLVSVPPSPFIACTNDDLANVQASLHARHLNPGIRTVARIHDNVLSRRLAATFQIDAAVNMSKVAAGAFVAEAMDRRAPRAFQAGETPYLAIEYSAKGPIDAVQIQSWSADGLQVLAVRTASGEILGPVSLEGGLQAGDRAIIAGPEVNVRLRLMFGGPDEGQA